MWAARVLVNSVEACRHGRKEVGLPSHVATFSKTEAASLGDKPLVKPNSFLNMLGIGLTISKQENGRRLRFQRPRAHLLGICATSACHLPDHIRTTSGWTQQSECHFQVSGKI